MAEGHAVAGQRGLALHAEVVVRRDEQRDEAIRARALQTAEKTGIQWEGVSACITARW